MVSEGRVPYHTHSEEVKEAVQMALRERKRVWDLRLLILFLFLVAILIGLGVQQERANHDRKVFENAVSTNCGYNRDNAIRFNALLERLRDSYRTSPVLTPRQRKDRLSFFIGVDQRLPVCPPAGKH